MEHGSFRLWLGQGFCWESLARIYDMAKKHDLEVHLADSEACSGILHDTAERSYPWYGRNVYRAMGADAIALRRTGQAAAFVTADCPVLALVDPVTGIVIAARVGLDGLATTRGSQPESAIASSVRLYQYVGADVGRLRILVACGIGPQSPDVAGEERGSTSRVGCPLAGTRAGLGSEARVDLFAIIRSQLCALGVPEANVARDGADTLRDSAHGGGYAWHSASRRDIGRNLVMVIRR